MTLLLSIAVAALAQSPPGLPVLGSVSFPGPSISGHSKSLILQLGLDVKHGWKLEWFIRSTAESYYGDIRAGTYASSDFGGVSAYAALYNQGVPLKLVQATVAYPWPFVARIESGIRSMNDLRGRKIGLPRGSYVYAHTVTAVKKLAGLDLEKDATVINVSALGTPVALARRDVEAAPVLLHQLVELQEKAPGEYKVLFDTASEFARAIGAKRSYQYQAIRTDWLQKHPGAINGVLATYRELSEFIRSKPETAISLLANPKDKGGVGLPPKIGDAHYGKGWEGMKVEWVSIPVSDLREALRGELEAYVAVGLLSKVPDDKFFYSP